MPAGAPKSDGDVMLVVKRWLADDRPQQIFCICSQSRLRHIVSGVGGIGVQPTGIAPRKTIAPKCRANLEAQAPKLSRLGFISGETATYLLQFARGELILPRRPTHYAFLHYRWDKGAGEAKVPAIAYPNEEGLRGVRVRSIGGGPVAIAPRDEGTDDNDIELNSSLS